MRSILISVRPRFAHALLDGTKTIEVRKRFPLNLGACLLFVYSSTPEKALIGTVRLHSVTTIAQGRLWVEHGPSLGIDEISLDTYLAKTSLATLLHVRDADPWAQAVPLAVLRAEFGLAPPQSWRYIDDLAGARLRSRGERTSSQINHPNSLITQRDNRPASASFAL